MAEFRPPSRNLTEHNQRFNLIVSGSLSERVKRWPRTAWRIWREQGFSTLVAASLHLLREAVFPHNYGRWISHFDTMTRKTRRDLAADIAGWAARPRISLLMRVGSVDVHRLERAVRSIERQLSPDWQLCVAFVTSASPEARKYLRQSAERDPRIRIAAGDDSKAHSGALDRALSLACGDFVATMGADAALPEHALYWLAKAIVARPDADIVFSDEDRIDADGRRCDPVFKPDWNPALMLAHNAVGQLALFRRDLVDRVGAFRRGFDGQEDYDLILRCAAATQPARIAHVPRVLHHRQATKDRMSEDQWHSGRRAIEQHLAACHVHATVGRAAENEYQVAYPAPVPPPRVSILVPTSGRPALIEPCLESLLKVTTYGNFEVLVLVNDIERRHAYRADLLERHAAEPRIRVLAYPDRPFNYAWVNNWGAATSSGEILCLLNDDTTIITPDWLEKLVARVSIPGVAAAGPMLYYPDDTIQHAGVILGFGGAAGHPCRLEPRGSRGYLGRAALEQDVSCVTAACMAIRRSVFRELGGFDEAFAVAYNDVDLCLRIRQAGWRIIWTPAVELYHFESASVGRHDAAHRRAQFRSEVALLRTRWAAVLDDDPFYNPNLSLRRQFAPAFPPRRRP